MDTEYEIVYEKKGSFIMRFKTEGKKIVSILLSLAMILGLGMTGAGMNIENTQAASALGANDFLKVNGSQIRKSKGNGETVYLRGTNAGGWLVQEDWMNPTNAPDQKTMMDTLRDRFGESVRDELVEVYENNYWTIQDFDNCAEMGMSVIRLPFTYMNLCDNNGDLKSNAFDKIDWFVDNCRVRGIYVILDMHGAFGSQNGMDHSGIVNDGKQLYYNQDNKDKTLKLWKKIAEHYHGNPAVAAYDILNEPGIKAAATYSLQWDFYNEIYNAIRSKDSDHIIIMESCWDADNIPNPSQYGWSNVAYEYHYYPWNAQNSTSEQASYIASKVKDISSHNYGVPTFVGEFTCFEQENAWKNTMSTYNQQGWHWTTWTYKVTGNSSWGIYNHNPQKVDIYNDSAEIIRQKWSEVGDGRAWKNDMIYNVIKEYLPGTVTASVGEGATFYEHKDYGGWAVTLGEGSYNHSEMVAVGIVNDEISSVKVPDGYKVILYEHADFGGKTKEVISDTSLLTDFNDMTSSIKIEKTNDIEPVVSYEKIQLPDGKYNIKSIANDKYIVAESAGNDPLVANRENYSGAWETFFIENNDDGTFYLKSEANNKYVCAVLDEEKQLVARSEIPSTWEKLQLYKIKDGEYGIRSVENGKYIKADLDNGGKLKAESDSIAGAWESFKLDRVGDSAVSKPKAVFYEHNNYSGWSVSLEEGRYDYNAMVSAGIKNDELSSVKVPDGYRVILYKDMGFSGGAKTLLQDTSDLGEFNEKTSAIVIEKAERVNFNNGNTYIASVANAKVVCAENAGNETIAANRESCGGAWETFQIVTNDDGTVSLKSMANQKYVCAVIDEDSQLIPRSEIIGTWEKFFIEKIAENEYAFYALANGKYVQANLNDDGKLYAVSETVAGAWEAFRVTKF